MESASDTAPKLVRVLVFGGRDFTDRARVRYALDRLHDELGPFAAVIHGGAPGADTEANLWAALRKVPAEPFPADWRAHGKAAGPIRNQQMIDHGKPTLAIAFPGGRGTADMTAKARAAGIKVWQA